jgi:hypothetical protein
MKGKLKIIALFQILGNHKGPRNLKWIHHGRVENRLMGLGIPCGLFSLYKVFDYLIEKKISDESFLKKVASRVRPSVIFDHKGSILIDQGGMAYLDNIEVTCPEREDRALFPEKIVVRPLRHLDHAPILTTLESDGFNQEATRGPKHDWIYTLDYFMLTEGESRTTTRFRLEIIV